MSSSTSEEVIDKLSTQRPPEGYWIGIWARFRKNKVNLFAFRFLVLLAAIALLADVIAYDKPIICQRDGTIEFPIIQDYLIDFGLYKRHVSMLHQDWRELSYDWALWPPVRFLPPAIDHNNQRLCSPFGKQDVPGFWHRHFLGTDRDGRDVMSGLVHGTRISLTIGFVAVGISSFIGIFLGALAGFYGDNRLQLSTAAIGLGLIGLILGFFYGFQVRSYVLRDALAAGAGSFLFQLALSFLIMIAVVVLFVQLARPFKRVPVLGKLRFVWVDVLVSRFIELKSTIPTLLLIITIMALVEKKNIYFVMVIIGLLGWTGPARFMRAEMLRTRSMPFIEAARSLGISELRIMFRHAIPNSLTSVLVATTFSVATAIIFEASLSFLGIGVPDNVVTWGGLLGEARVSQSAWWLAVFPGMAVFLTVTALNLVGEGLRDALDPRLRHE